MSISDNRSQSLRSEVLAVKTKHKNRNMKSGSAPQPTGGKTGKNVLKPLECYRCGSTTHLGNAKFSPALDKMCAKCYKKGHFAKVCKSSMSNNSDKLNHKVNSVVTNNYSSSSSEEGEVFMVNDKEPLIGEVRDSGVRRPFCLVEIDGVQVHMMADSGSPFTLLSETKWNDLFRARGVTLKPSLIDPIGYGGKSIDVVGEFQAVLKFKDNITPAIIYVTKDDTCLLGWCDQGKLKLVLDPNNPEQVVMKNEYLQVSSVMCDKWESRYPEIFNGNVGLFKGRRCVGYVHAKRSAARLSGGSSEIGTRNVMGDLNVVGQLRGCGRCGRTEVEAVNIGSKE
ncbi:hypothetical protein NDU88_004013 [Pleurodeles waltl]|uniref:CCHC-type domain-containing protein n=1 Tax=Pleurodeles waltl TaxID=8319 RepID=A0AAV7UDR1_PLEWA|nr:hypothetical protein NDU88_004013 [Pleurodeles waltl]